jgi:hypothetical protein
MHVRLLRRMVAWAAGACYVLKNLVEGTDVGGGPRKEHMEVIQLCETLELIAEIMALCQQHPNLLPIASERLNEITARYNINGQPSPSNECPSSWRKTIAYREIQELFDGSRKMPPIGEFRELVTRILSSYNDCKFKGPPKKKVLYQKLNEHWTDIKEQTLRALRNWKPS